MRTDEPYDQHQVASNPSFQELDRDTRFRDGSWPLFSLYSTIAEEEDNKLAKRWQKDADEILIYVRPCTILRPLTHINQAPSPAFLQLQLQFCLPCPRST